MAKKSEKPATDPSPDKDLAPDAKHTPPPGAEHASLHGPAPDPEP